MQNETYKSDWVERCKRYVNASMHNGLIDVGHCLKVVIRLNFEKFQNFIFEGKSKKLSLLKLFEIFEIIDENSHCPNDHFQGNNESHIKGEFVKIREFNLVLIALIFIQK